MSIQLIDESLPRREDAIVVVLFYKTIENMPRILVNSVTFILLLRFRDLIDLFGIIKHVGDVIRFHKVQVKQYQDKFQIVGQYVSIIM
jgi:hypothetical protein